MVVLQPCKLASMELRRELTTVRDVSDPQGECTSLPVAEPGTTALGTAKYNMTC